MIAVKRQLLAAAGLVLATVAWGASFVLVKMTVAQMNVYSFLFLRFLVAAALLSALFSRRVLAADRATIRAAFALSLLLAFAFAAQTEGLRFTAAANSALITCLYMIFIPFFTLLARRSRVEPASILGALIAFFGMYLLTSGSLTGFNAGDLLTLACAITFAWHFLLTSRYARRHALVPLVAYQFLFTALFCGAVAWAQDGIAASVPRVGVLTILFTAIFATVIAFLIQTAAQRVLSPTRTGVLCSLEAVFGAAIPWTIGFERPTMLAAAGAVVMIAGMVLSELGSVLTTVRRRPARADRASVFP